MMAFTPHPSHQHPIIPSTSHQGVLMHAFFQKIILRQSKPAKIGLPKGKKTNPLVNHHY
jgi:hypothetical protein